MIINRLKKELKMHKLPVHRKKVDLVEWLQKAMLDEFCVIVEKNVVMTNNTDFCLILTGRLCNHLLMLQRQIRATAISMGL